MQQGLRSNRCNGIEDSFFSGLRTKKRTVIITLCIIRYGYVIWHFEAGIMLIIFKIQESQDTGKLGYRKVKTLERSYVNYE